jgi:hypothetical protein
MLFKVSAKFSAHAFSSNRIFEYRSYLPNIGQQSLTYSYGKVSKNN